MLESNEKNRRRRSMIRNMSGGNGRRGLLEKKKWSEQEP